MTFESIQAQIVPDTDHVWILEHKLVAEAYGTSASNIHNLKRNRSEELIEGSHYFKQTTSDRGEVTFWSKTGVMKLGMFIKSEQAASFREWAAQYLGKSLSYTVESQQGFQGLPPVSEAADQLVAAITRQQDDWKAQVKAEVAARLGKLESPLAQVAAEMGVTL